MSRSAGRVSAAIYLAVSLAVSYINFGSSVAIPAPGLGDLPLFVILGLHYAWGIALLLSSTEYRRFHRSAYRRLLFVPEVLGAVSLLFFLFSFIFALNANMDYVQRFIESGGNLRLALDTRTERLLVWIRVFPLVALDVGTWLLFRIGRPALVRAAHNERSQPPDFVVRPWAFAATLSSAFLVAIAMPSFLDLDGFPLLGWVAWVPLFLVLRSARFGRGVFYGITFGVFTTLLSSYWLGTFSLVSLQITVLFFFIYWAIFTPLARLLYRHIRFARVLVFPLAITLFEYLRSTGFLGYPWALAAHSQYSVLPIIQMAEVTGVWGVSFLVLLGNSAIAEFVGAAINRFSARRTTLHRHPPATVRRSFGWLTGATLLIGAVALAGTVVLALHPEPPDDARVVTVAQIQQNNDPRKSDYENTFETLTTLTDATMEADPDLVVWSETAFVPNIRRWSEDDSIRRFHRLVGRFLEYQESLGTWLVTGNDDYEVVRDVEGREVERLNYNAAVLFDDEGRRRETYRKIQLVPFTEHFPYREQLPWVYELLLEFDVNFWEQGTEPTVFQHPLFAFSTPICYEDVFPNYVRGFVRAGADVILNISNDYWSLAETQAKQHFVAGLFRAVENRRPVLRTTASGVTGQIDPYGRIVRTVPQFEEAALVSRVPIDPAPPTTLYTRWGDYVPLGAGALLLLLLGGSLVSRAVDARRARRGAGTGDAGREAPASPSDPSVPSRTEPPAAPREDAPRPGDVSAPSGEKKRPRRTPRARRAGRMSWRELWYDD
ncbi:MAG: apolipoprotein N-acyltransferase [Spirochaetota bacterium]